MAGRNIPKVSSGLLRLLCDGGNFRTTIDALEGRVADAHFDLYHYQHAPRHESNTILELSSVSDCL